MSDRDLPRADYGIVLKQAPYALTGMRERLVIVGYPVMLGTLRSPTYVVRPEAIEIDPAEEIPAECEIPVSREQMQALANALWDAGYRPQAAQGSAGQLAAVSAHLADVQRILDRSFALVEKGWQKT